MAIIGRTYWWVLVNSISKIFLVLNMRSKVLAPPTLKTELVPKFDDKEKSLQSRCHKLIFYLLKSYGTNIIG